MMGEKEYCEVYTCKQLWADVFRMGLVDANRERRLVLSGKCVDMEAIRWMESEEVFPGSFVWLCYLFGLLPDRVRLNAANIRKTPNGSDEDLFA